MANHACLCLHHSPDNEGSGTADCLFTQHYSCQQCDFRFDLFLVLVLVFPLFFSFNFVPVLSNLLTKTC